MSTNKNSKNYIIHIMLILGSIIMIGPFLWMLLTSFKSFTEATHIPIIIFPKNWTMASYIKAWNLLPFTAFYWNTFLMMFFRVIFSVFTSAAAGYAFARIKFPGRNALFMIILIQMMVPGQIFIIPQFLIVQKLGLLNTVSALVFPGIVSAFGTFLLRQFYMSIPMELEEAAILDGCNRGQIFIKIMLPLTKSGMIALGIFTSLFAWKDLMWPLIVNMSLDKMPLASGLASLQGQYMTDFPQLMAGSVMAIWPMLLIFIIFQKQFIAGIATSGSKT